MARESHNIAIGVSGFAALMVTVLALLFAAGGAEATAQAPTQSQSEAQGPAAPGTFLGVASCGGTTCHGRSIPNVSPDQPSPPADAAIGVVRQDEILIWQDPASAAGAHSRAFAVLQEPRSRQIAKNFGLGEATSAPECLGCHATPTLPSQRGARFLRSDGVSCEGCHGPASSWLSYHYSAGATHQGNLDRRMIKLEDPRRRAETCLNCHFGHRDADRFVTHRLMAAGHPRISFELDLFSTLQAHHDEDADYRKRKSTVGNVQMWAIGQSVALERSLFLFAETDRGWDGIFPEFYFLDCHSCHRQIFDKRDFDPSVVSNPARPLPSGMPPYNDENMIMLSAAARVVAPAAGRRFDEASKQFHAAMASNPGAVRAAAKRLKDSATELAEIFGSGGISDAQVFRIIDAITSQAISPRFTDYAGSVQAVMATDTLLSALVATGSISNEAIQGIRGDIDGAYRAVSDPNLYKPDTFRTRLGRAAAAIRRLR